jgi:hypothetical protein
MDHSEYPSIDVRAAREGSSEKEQGQRAGIKTLLACKKTLNVRLCVHEMQSRCVLGVALGIETTLQTCQEVATTYGLWVVRSAAYRVRVSSSTTAGVLPYAPYASSTQAMASSPALTEPGVSNAARE